MIGIGCTSYKRPKHLELFIKQVNKHTKDFTLYVAKDIPSVSQAKNECINALKDCEHIFLFDDDCYPIADGWADYFINSGLDHSCYMVEHPLFRGNIFSVYNDAKGVFMHITKEVVNQVGYFNTKYDRYGYEHAAYSHRINRAGLSKARFLCLNDANKYLWSLDLQGVGEFDIEHKSSMCDTLIKELYIKNKAEYARETTSNQIKYEYGNK